METERIALSQRERDRLRVLHEVKQKQITYLAEKRTFLLCVATNPVNLGSRSESRGGSLRVRRGA